MIVDCAHYKDGARQHEEPIDARAGGRARRRRGDGEFVWIGMHEPEPGDLEQLQELFGLHELAVEDAERPTSARRSRTTTRPASSSCKTAHYHEDTRGVVHFGEIHVFVGPGYVITVRHGPGSELDHRAQAARGAARPAEDGRRLGASGRSSTRSSTTTCRSSTGSRTTSRRSRRTSSTTTSRRRPQRIYTLKREVIEFHRAVWPLLSPLDALERGGYERVPEELRRYFRDVADHARRVDEQVTSQRELLTSVLEANLALVSVNQNEVVKKISAVVGDHRRPDLHRQRLRHELRAHARARTGARLPAGPGG